MPVTLLRAAAWLSILLIALVTVSPIWLRPVTSASADLERFVAFVVVGALFAAAYPERVVLVVGFVILAAGILEFGQNLVSDRHGTFNHFVVKSAGGAIGAIAGRLIYDAFKI